MNGGTRWRTWAALACLFVAWGGSEAANAAVVDVTITDVTTRAFAVVWVSDQPVTAATVRVFADAGGTTELTSTLGVTLVSASFPPALNQGIVKVEVSGLAADTTVFVQTQTTTAGGTVHFPAAQPFLAARTAVLTTKANSANQVIVNDLIEHGLFEPDGVTPATGTLVMVAVPGIGAAPLTAFAGEGFPAPRAVVDLNNLYDVATGVSVEVPANAVMTITEVRGLLCPGLQDQRLLRYRRVPAHTETPPITELESGVPCFFADTVCDGTVNILDAQRVLNLFNRALGECAFNPDLDVVPDEVINILDVQAVLNRFGQSEPFP